MSGRLEGRIALITGTAGGQGRAGALLFAQEGATVIGCDLLADDDAETARLVEQRGGTMTSIAPVDLADDEQAGNWIERAISTAGRVDILYNNASAARLIPFELMTPDDWHFTLRNELDLVYYTCRHAWAHFKNQGHGTIINTASTLGMRGIEQLGSSAHSAANGAVIAFTRQLAVEGAPDNIRVNAISPGTIDSPATADVLSIPGAKEQLATTTLVGRIGEVNDIAKAALFLASDDSEFVTGTNLVVDGGTTAVIRNPLTLTSQPSPVPTPEGTT